MAVYHMLTADGDLDYFTIKTREMWPKLKPKAKSSLENIPIYSTIKVWAR